MLKTLEWTGEALRLVDQTKLPLELTYVDITTPQQMHDAIKRLVVRGAPAIGIAAAFGAYLGVRNAPQAAFAAELKRVCDYLATSRPTAVNLFWALARIGRAGSSPKRILEECLAMIDEDNRVCRSIGEHGLSLLMAGVRAGQKLNLITHCNAGGLATAQFGTALSPIYAAKERGIAMHVFVDETRPLLQGARITAMELMQNGIDCTLVCDSMAASVFSKFPVDAVIVGTDRVAANGDVANKIGTHSLAIVARHFGVPFYVACPTSTLDISLADGSQIPIEERAPEEIANGFGKRTAPPGVKCFNPAFDVTTADLVSAIITEKGVLYPPFDLAIKSILG